MPTYDYVCKDCGTVTEFFHMMSETPVLECPECGSHKLERQIGSGGGIIFKGSGFYETDYRSQSYKDGAKKDSESSKKSPDKKSKKDG